MIDIQEVVVPWAALPQQWGHPWHRMCSYLGTFPAALARSLIAMLTEEGDTVLDPFAGRGTTLLESRLTGRIPLASDLNPIAIALSRAKNTAAPLSAVLERISTLEQRYDSQLYEPEARVESDEILLIYHPGTLAQLLYLRRKLTQSRSEIDQFLVGCVLGIMHGKERMDGSSAYASISMPNTYSMPPNYVRRFVETNQLQRVRRNVFELLRTKVARLYQGGLPFETTGVVARADAKRVSAVEAFIPYRGAVKLALGSPPYLDVVNYARQNWIRSWFLDQHPDQVSEELDDNLTLAEWLDFAESVATELNAMLRPDGAIVLVVGDVARTSRSVISLAREFIRRILHTGRFAYVGCFSDRIQTDIKTTRIWKDTKGQATAVDRVIVLANEAPEFRYDRLPPEMQAMVADDATINARRLSEYALSFAGH